MFCIYDQNSADNTGGFSYYWTVLHSLKAFFASDATPSVSRLEWARSWEGTQLIPVDQRDTPHSMMSWSAIKAEGMRREGRHSEISLRSSWTPDCHWNVVKKFLFLFCSCSLLLSPLKCLYLNLRVFSLSPFCSLPILLQESEWAAVWSWAASWD